MTNMFSKVIGKGKRRVRHRHYTAISYPPKRRHESKMYLECNHCSAVEREGSGGQVGKLEWLIDHLRSKHGLVFSSIDWRNNNV